MAVRSRRTSLAALVVIWCVSVLLPGIAHSQQRPGTVAGPYGVCLEKSVLLHMRDGVRLSTDLYFPVGAPEPLPVMVAGDASRCAAVAGCEVPVTGDRGQNSIVTPVLIVVSRDSLPSGGRLS